MGLFDNIFLDQNTPTVLAPETTVQTVDAPEKATENTPEGTIHSTPTGDTPPTSVPDTDISFDIGGDIDFGTSGADTGTTSGTFLGGGEVFEAPQGDTPTDTLSIAMIQGATNASGALIVGETGEVKSEQNAASSPEIIEEKSEDIDEGASSEENDTALETGVVENISLCDEDKSQALFGLLGDDTDEEKSETTLTQNEEVTKEQGTTENLISSISTDETHLSTSHTDLDSELEHFIAKLEEIREKNKKGTSYETKLNDIQMREAALEEEVCIRKKALEYERAEVLNEQKQDTEEQNRLERIIESLKKETK